MQKLGYGPDKRLKIKVTTRDLPFYRDPAVILIDQLKQVYIDGELETDRHHRSTFPKIIRKDFTVALNLQTSGPDPDPILELFYGCGSSLNWDGYCNPEIDKLIEQQSREGDAGAAQAAGLGRSSANWPRTTPGRSSSIPAARPAGSPMSKG